MAVIYTLSTGDVLSTRSEAAHEHGIGWHVWVGVIVTIIPATLLVGLRFIARVTSRAGLKEDDWTIFAALVSVASHAWTLHLEEGNVQWQRNRFDG